MLQAKGARETEEAREKERETKAKQKEWSTNYLKTKWAKLADSLGCYWFWISISISTVQQQQQQQGGNNNWNSNKSRSLRRCWNAGDVGAEAEVVFDLRADALKLLWNWPKETAREEKNTANL